MAMADISVDDITFSDLEMLVAFARTERPDEPGVPGKRPGRPAVHCGFGCGR
jgi:hypothetical protein